MSVSAQSQLNWAIRVMSGFGVPGNLGNTGCPPLPVEGIAANYLAFIELASIRIWLRANQSAP